MRSLYTMPVIVGLLLLLSACTYVRPLEVVAQDEVVSDEDTEAESPEQALEEMDPSNFDNPTQIDNEWWPLTPGMQYVYEGFQVEDDEEIPHRIIFTVTDLTKTINGVPTVVVFDRDFSDGELEESELAFFAQDNDGNVWHFGQYRETYDEVEFVGGRVWLVDLPEGAHAGIMMTADPQPDTPSYSQGYAPAPFNWTDRARVDALGEETSIALGDYEDVLVIEEYNDEEPGAFQLKYYARGVGNIRIGWRGDDTQQEEMELVEIVELDADEMAALRAEALQLEERAYMYSLTTPAEQMAE